MKLPIAETLHEANAIARRLRSSQNEEIKALLSAFAKLSLAVSMLSGEEQISALANLEKADRKGEGQ